MSKSNKANEPNEEEKSSIYIIQEQDTLELNCLKKLKTDLLQFLIKKEELLKKVSADPDKKLNGEDDLKRISYETSSQIFNVMTLQAFKILKMMLKFGIFNAELEVPVETFKKKTLKTFIPTKLFQSL